MQAVYAPNFKHIKGDVPLTEGQRCVLMLSAKCGRRQTRVNALELLGVKLTQFIFQFADLRGIKLAALFEAGGRFGPAERRHPVESKEISN